MFSIQEFPGGRNLLKDGLFVCPDTPLWTEFHVFALAAARGHVLTTGLGFGLAASYLAGLEAVEGVTVIENDLDLIYFIGPLASEKIEVIWADAWSCDPGRTFDFAWHDIWSNHIGVGAECHALISYFEAFVCEQRAMPLCYPEFLATRVSS